MKKFIFIAGTFLLTVVLAYAQPTTWQVKGIGGGGAFFRPSINPGNADQYCVPTDMGPFFMTTDFGRHYSELSFKQLVGNNIGLIRYTNDPKRIYAIGNKPSVDKFAFTLYVSTDGGNSWNQPAGITNPVNSGISSATPAYGLHVDYTNPNRLVVSTQSSIYYSSDSAQSFTDIGTAVGLNAALSEYAFGCFFDGSTILIGTNQGVLESVNNGQSWQLTSWTGIGSGENIIGFAGAKQGNKTRLFCITGASNGNYNGWDVALAAAGISDLLKGVYSLDYGSSTSWISKTTGITMPSNGCYPCDHINWLGMAGNDINTVYLYGGNGNSEPTVLKTSDGGDHWTHVFNITNNQNIFTGYMGYKGDPFQWYLGNAGMDVCQQNADVVVLANMGCVMKTKNGGLTWEQAYVNPADQNDTGMQTPKHKPYRGVGIENTTNWNMVWSSPTDILGCLTDIGSIRSRDGGTYWSFNDFHFNTMYMALKHPQNATLYACVSDKHDMYGSTTLQDHAIDDPVYSNGKLLMSGDTGYSWTEVHDFTRPVYFIAFDVHDANTLYVSVVNHKQGLGGIYVTHNLSAGASSTWTMLPAPPRTEGHPSNIISLKDGKLLCTYGPRMTDWSDSPAGKFTRSSGVFLYDPTTQTWTDKTDLNTMGWYCNDVYVDPADTSESTWLVGVSSGWGWTDAAGNTTPNSQGGLYRTTDRGTTWTKLIGDQGSVLSLGGGVFSCKINPLKKDQLVVTTIGDGLIICDDIYAASPQFRQESSFQFGNPLRIFFNPYDETEWWITTYGNGLHVGKVNATGVFSLQQSVNDLSVFPNPVTDAFQVSGPAQGTPSTLWLTDMQGRIMHTELIQPGVSSKRVSVCDYPAGMYLLHWPGCPAKKLMILNNEH